MAGRNRTAVDLTIDALRHLGRLDQIDESLVAAAESLADAVDADPGHASLWREYRAALMELRSVGNVDSQDDDEFYELLNFITSEMGDREEP